MRYRDYIREGKERLYKAGQGEQAATLLMVELCRQKGINLYMDMDEEILDAIRVDYLEAIHEMEKGKPLSYVLGYESFYGYDFIVNEDVLIPRPETEELVGLVLSLFDEHFSEAQHVTVFDVATGSGAIGITLDLEEPRMDVIASDISSKAVDVALQNNEKLQGHVNFIIGNMLDPFIERDLHCDICVCNPPYIPSDEKMEHSVVDFEPHVALFGGKDGLKFYRDVFEKADQVLKEKAFMAFEIGYDQRESLSQLAREYFPDAKIEVHKDMSGKDRMLTIERGF
ncbi:peptide chain release factor N(5)-glutamine methyltransferase [uncultured Faecalicoccus sp.]|uniref:peptide chain release factor N(5)-glutamine methyltransferase n=1 Tax=uncultured Faecalicoccus sp. TaxID=1971760 RepID=UPI002607480A|nr:peptide chain release factor N(5)-glutamine methyltransferase [uncultured Faecalicoccus sp.]